jgi:rhodanese-related sulfurtransferase
MTEPGTAAERATSASPTATGERITPAQLHAWLEAGEPVLVLDVRGRERWTAELERIPGAAWLPIEELSRRARDLPARRLVVYCSSPGEARSARTARWLEDHGHRDVFVLSGGLAAWRSARLPVETMRLDLAAEARAAEQALGLPTLLEQYRRAGRLPTRVRLATLFVDIVGSMRLLAHTRPSRCSPSCSASCV